MEKTVQEYTLIRSFNLFGEINNTLAESFTDFANHIITQEEINIKNNPLGSYQPSIQPVNLFINTPGGSVTAGSSIIFAINRLQNFGIPVIGYSTGMVMSMGIPILIACDVRRGDSMCHYMIHGASCGDFNYVNRSIKYLEYVKKMNDKLDKFMVERSNITMELLKEYEENEYWFDYDESLNLGIITDDIYAEEEPDILEIAINTISSMKKSDIINYIEQTQQSIQTKLETENKKKTKDKIIINVFEEALVNIDYVFEELSNVSNIKELSETTMIIIYNIINPLIAEEEEGLDEE